MEYGIIATVRWATVASCPGFPDDVSRQGLGGDLGPLACNSRGVGLAAPFGHVRRPESFLRAYLVERVQVEVALVVHDGLVCAAVEGLHR